MGVSFQGRESDQSNRNRRRREGRATSNGRHRAAARLPPAVRAAILGGMDKERRDYGDDDAAPSWLELTDNRNTLLAGLSGVAAFLLTGLLLALLGLFLLGP